ncbi:DUF3304 domain-containing protein [Paraburkholderia terricola]|uniref:DUF3304 domain-containing protein n=2 Tax=Burkholderiaceae TaxID=119060 RepID=A0A1M6WDA7_9BURK|nr:MULTISPECIES: DUF3304 domain-containing protein [Paraburkholderia]SDP17888.1 Protein of unknown function [Paraburkholderia sediminicola]SHK91667.1 Protein of unknown function [Paraburkholderia terricola]
MTEPKNMKTGKRNTGAGPRLFQALVALALGLVVAGCHPQQTTASSSANAVDAAKGEGESYPAGVSGLNYSTYGIASFSITDAEGKTGGGPNISPSKGDGKPAGGGAEMCCVIVPSKWHEGMTVTVQWERDTHPYDDKDRSGDQWLKAVAKVPPYGPTQYNFWVQFLDGDRIRVRVDDGSPLEKPSEHDPYIAQGVLDDDANKAMQAARERDRQAAEEYRQQLREQDARAGRQGENK